MENKKFEVGDKVHVKNQPYTNGEITSIHNTIYDAEKAGILRSHADWLDQQDYQYYLSDNATPWIAIFFGTKFGSGLYGIGRVRHGHISHSLS